MTSTSIYLEANSPKPFRPTYLAIKQHSITGKLYLCKRFADAKGGRNIDSYKGSGKYWMRHISKHNRKYVKNLWYCLFTEKEELEKFAMMISEQWDIVNSNEWANLKLENGLDGIGRTEKLTEAHCESISKGLTGRKLSKESIENHAESIADTWIIYLPLEGTNKPDLSKSRHIIVKKLRKWVRDNPQLKLDRRSLQRVLTGEYSNHKGYQLDKLI